MFNGKNKKKTFLAAMTMLLVSAIVITSASFAWFSLGKNAQVNNIDVKVTAKEGIAISANVTNFTDVITFANLNGSDEDATTSKFNAVTGNVNYFSNVLVPSSSEFAINNSLPTFYTGGIDASLTGTGKTMTATKVDDESKAGFYAFDVYVKFVSEVADKTTVVKVGNSAITVKDQADQDEGVTADANVANAIRVGFVNCGIDTNTSVAPTGTAACIFANDATAATTLPVNAAGESADIGSSATVSSANKGSLGLASAYGCDVAIKGETSSTAQLTLKNGINRIRVYIWMEGQDANCVDEMASQKLSINLVFAAA